MLRQTKRRRVAAAVLVVAGGALMWLAPSTTFAPLSTVGIALLAAGAVVEAIGIALEHRDRNERGRRNP